MKNVPFFFNNEIVKDEYLKWLPAIKFLFTESSLTTSVYSRLFSLPSFSILFTRFPERVCTS